MIGETKDGTQPLNLAVSVAVPIRLGRNLALGTWCARSTPCYHLSRSIDSVQTANSNPGALPGTWWVGYTCLINTGEAITSVIWFVRVTMPYLKGIPWTRSNILKVWLQGRKSVVSLFNCLSLNYLWDSWKLSRRSKPGALTGTWWGRNNSTGEAMLHLLILGLVTLSFGRPESPGPNSVPANTHTLIFKPRICTGIRITSG